MRKIYKRASAKRDLEDHFVYLAQNAGLDIAGRFLINAEASFNDLAHEPLIGTQLILQQPALTGLRRWRIKGFENHLIFYLPRSDGVSIIRVLHAARDWWSLLGLIS